VSDAWKSKVGTSLSVNWPVGIGGKGGEGVAGQVKQVPGGIGYFELAYAKEEQHYLRDDAEQGRQLCCAQQRRGERSGGWRGQ